MMYMRNNKVLRYHELMTRNSCTTHMCYSLQTRDKRIPPPREQKCTDTLTVLGEAEACCNPNTNEALVRFTYAPKPPLQALLEKNSFKSAYAPPRNTDLAPFQHLLELCPRGSDFAQIASATLPRLNIGKITVRTVLTFVSARVTCSLHMFYHFFCALRWPKKASSLFPNFCPKDGVLWCVWCECGKMA